MPKLGWLSGKNSVCEWPLLFPQLKGETFPEAEVSVEVPSQQVTRYDGSTSSATELFGPLDTEN